MVRGKKAFFFTFIAIMLVVLFFLIINTRQTIENMEEADYVRHRVETVNNLFFDLENELLSDINTAIAARAMKGLIVQINESQIFFGNDTQATEAFVASMWNGSYLNGSPFWYMQGHSIEDILGRFRKQVNDTFQISFNLSLLNDSLEINQTGRFDFTVYARYRYSAETREAEWLPKHVDVVSEFSVIGFDDPYYLLMTGGNYTQPIAPDPLISQSWDAWNVTHLNRSIHDHTYMWNLDAMSYWQRFFNDTSSSPYGIESFINADILKHYVAPDYLNFSAPQNRSYVDYMFWYPTWNCSDYDNPTGRWGDLRGVQGVNATGFRLDRDHIGRYLNVSRNESRDQAVGGLTYVVCTNS
ncbi:MAG: hypothetical protein ACOCWQ_02940 [Nanoarchaeota archaeon]